MVRHSRLSVVRPNVANTWAEDGSRTYRFSKGERNTFVIVQRIIVVRDIREQFPLLPLEETLALAKSLGVRHPMDKGEPVVMTTDFLITRVCSGDTSYEALSVKQKCMLEDPRVIEKLEIERLYWARYEVPWRIVTHEDVDCPLANNLHWINERWDVQDPSLNAEEIDILERRLFEYLTNQTMKHCVSRVLDAMIASDLKTEHAFLLSVMHSPGGFGSCPSMWLLTLVSRSRC